jgi:hypothetical protein
MSQNNIGDLGEAIFNVAISRGFLFKPMFLGEKWPIADFYVELIDDSDRVMFFIVQIKATNQGYLKNGNLRVQLPKKKLHELNGYNCPTYLAGIDNENERVFMKSINKNKRKSIPSLESSFELNQANLKILYEDVKLFWKGVKMKSYKSNFKHKL